MRFAPWLRRHATLLALASAAAIGGQACTPVDSLPDAQVAVPKDAGGRDVGYELINPDATAAGLDAFGGMPDDAGQPDTGAILGPDAATPIDASTPPDAAEPPDAAVPLDAATPPDAGQPGDPTITDVAPAFGTVEGGDLVTVSGTNLAGVAVTLGGAALSPTMAGDGKSLTITTPAHAAGMVLLTLVNGTGGTASRAQGFEYVYKLKAGRSLAADGGISNTWTSDYLAATEPHPDAGLWGAANALNELYVAYDSTGLWIGIAGTVDTNPSTTDALVIYLDRDFGAGTGIKDMSTLTDVTGLLDNACSGKLNASGVTGFGAEFCLGTFGMNTVLIGDVYPATDKAGMRDIATDPTNFHWAVDTAATPHSTVTVAASLSGSFVEAYLPWNTIFTSGLPASGAQLALFVRITNFDGSQHANLSLPHDDDTSTTTVETVHNVLVISVR
jgi:hypothetical protein